MDAVEEALAGLKAGEAIERNYELLLRRYYQRIRNSLASRIGMEDAKELSQEVFRAVYEYRESLPENRRAFRTWLFRTAKHKFIHNLQWSQRLKRSGIEIPLDDPDTRGPQLVDDELDSEARVMRKETSKRIRAAMESLPPRQRDCVELFYLQQLKVAEVAIVLGISPGTVKHHLFTARNTLKERLGDEVDGLEPGEEE